MLQVNVAGREVKVGRAEVAVTTTEFDILALLDKHRGKVLTRSTIIANVWGRDFLLYDTRLVDQHVSRLRRKLRRHKVHHLLVSVNRHGYKLKAA